MSTRIISGCCAIALLAGTLAAKAQEPGQANQAKAVEIEGVLLGGADDAGRYWIGVAVEPRDNGLVIESVAPDSPAAKAGLKPGDVIVAVKDTPIKEYEQLAKFVADSEGKALELQIARDEAEQRANVKAYAKGVLNLYDRNKDDRLEKDEWQKMRPNLQASDDDKDGVITLEELVRKIATFVSVRRKMSVMVQPIKQSGGGLVIIAAGDEKKEGDADDKQPKPVAPPQPGPQFRIEGATISGSEIGGLRLQLVPSDSESGDSQKHYDPRVTDKADKEVLPRFDRDKDGFLTVEESQESDWDPPFLDSDLDKDGRLSRSELYERYAKKMNLPPSTAGAEIAARSPAGVPGPAWQPMMTPGASAQLPDDMEVKVTKKGNRPAVVKVSQGKKSWKTTEDELGMLPPPAQAYAARLLGKGPGAGMSGMPGTPRMSGRSGMMGPGMESGMPGMPSGVPAMKATPAPGGGLRFEIRETEERKPSQKSADERAAEIDRLLQQERALRKALEELRRVREVQGENK